MLRSENDRLSPSAGGRGEAAVADWMGVGDGEEDGVCAGALVGVTVLIWMAGADVPVWAAGTPVDWQDARARANKSKRFNFLMTFSHRFTGEASDPV
jgi:hypothetical protein